MKNKSLVINENKTSLKLYIYTIPDKLLLNMNFEKVNKSDNQNIFKYKERYFKIYLPNYEKLLEFFINKLNHINSIYKENKTIVDINEIAIIGIKKSYNNSYLEKIIMEKFPTIEIENIEDEKFYEYIEQKNKDSYSMTHNYITNFMKKMSVRDDVNIISCCIDEEVSICSIKDGKCINTITSLPINRLLKKNIKQNTLFAIKSYISKLKKISIIDINKNNIYLNDKDIELIVKNANSGNTIAQIILREYIDIIVSGIKESYKVLNEKVDTIVLSGIVGENSIIIRKLIIEKLHETFNVELNEKENKEISFDSKIKNGVITTNNSQIPIFVIQNKEELMILEELNNKLKNTKKLIYKQKY